MGSSSSGRKGRPISIVNGKRGRTCIECGLWYPLDYFYADERRSDGHRSKCIECTKRLAREYKREKRTERALRDTVSILEKYGARRVG